MTLAVVLSSCTGLGAESGGSTVVEPGAAVVESTASTGTPEVSALAADGGTTTLVMASNDEDPAPAPVEPEPGALAELEQAGRSSVEVSGPYAYVTLIPVCEGCGDGVGAQLYLIPSDEDPLVRTLDSLWVDGEPSEPRAEDLWAIDPARVPDRLIRAIGEGRDVRWEIDPITLMVRSWSIDGVGATYSCYQIDTASIERRDKDCYGGLLGRG